MAKPRAYYRFDQSAEPDVWLDAVQVWEVKCADLSLSPVYKAAMGMVSSTFVRFRVDGLPSVTVDRPTASEGKKSHN